MSEEEYSLKFTILSRYDPSMESNPRDHMSRFVTGVFDLVKKECSMGILQNDMNLSMLVVYAQSIEESKPTRISKNFKRGESNEKINHA